MIVSETPPEWIGVALTNMDTVLVDHAHCEKKAAASAMSLVVGYPEHQQLVRRMSSRPPRPRSWRRSRSSLEFTNCGCVLPHL